MKLKRKQKKNNLIDFLKNQSFFTNFYNIELTKSKKLPQYSIEYKLQNIEPFSNEYNKIIEQVFITQFSQNLITELLSFLKQYRNFYFTKSPTWDDQYKLLEQYWILINLIKIDLNVKIFNEYIIFLNKEIYEKQKGFRHIK